VNIVPGTQQFSPLAVTEARAEEEKLYSVRAAGKVTVLAFPRLPDASCNPWLHDWQRLPVPW
jgi:hypothetical protein